MQGWARQDSNLGPRDYESPALTAELQARCALTREHPISYLQRPIFSQANSKSAFRDSQGEIVCREIRVLAMSSEVETSLDFSKAVPEIPRFPSE